MQYPAPTIRPVLRDLDLRVEGSGGVDIGRLQKIFPDVHPHVMSAGDADLDFERWHRTDFDFWAFDRQVDAIVDAGRTLAIRAPARHASRFALEVLTRAQRRIEHRNAASRAPLFDRVLEAHRGLHDLERPLVQADYDHALDCWQWTLRLDAGASLDVQLAALLHDVERLVSESDERVEQHAPDYRAFKEAHARAGAPLAQAILRHAGADETLARDVAALVARSETPSGAHDVREVNDADALSFFSINSPGFIDYFGVAHARKKIAYTIARMSGRALEELPNLRMRADVAAIVAEALDAPFPHVEAFG